MNKDTMKRVALTSFVIFGLLLSVELVLIYHRANFDRYALSSFCSINDFIDCDGVAKTTFSQFLGIPLAIWGIFFYITMLFLIFVDKLKEIKFLKFLEVFKNPMAYISTLCILAFMCSMVLATISLNIINKICLLCVITYFINLFMAIVASNASLKVLTANIKTTFADFIAGAKQYKKTFVTLLVLAIGFLSYSAIEKPFVPHIKKRASIMKYRSMKTNPYLVKGNVLGAENADVVVEVYSDYVCPICRINNIMLHQAAKEFRNVKVVHYSFPFDKTCNPFVTSSMHPSACFMSRAAIAAGKQGNYWEMNTKLYEQQPKKFRALNPIVKEMGLDKDKFMDDFVSAETGKELFEQIQQGMKVGISGTPTMVINGNKYVGMKPYYELKTMLKKHGAKINPTFKIQEVKNIKNRFSDKIAKNK